MKPPPRGATAFWLRANVRNLPPPVNQVQSLRGGMECRPGFYGRIFVLVHMVQRHERHRRRRSYTEEKEEEEEKKKKNTFLRSFWAITFVLLDRFGSFFHQLLETHAPT